MEAHKTSGATYIAFTFLSSGSQPQNQGVSRLFVADGSLFLYRYVQRVHCDDQSQYTAYAANHGKNRDYVSHLPGRISRESKYIRPPPAFAGCQAPSTYRKMRRTSTALVYRRGRFLSIRCLYELVNVRPSSERDVLRQPHHRHQDSDPQIASVLS